MSNIPARESRLIPFEHFMLADDRATHPMTFGFRLTFRGNLDKEQLKKTFSIAANQHPLLSSTVIRRRGHWVWSLPEEGASHPGWQEPKSDTQWSFDLTKEPGLRVSIAERAAGWELWVQVHHSCTDAHGALNFLADWFAHYEGRGMPADRRAARPFELGHRDFARQRSLWRYAFPYGKNWSRIWAYYGKRPTPILTSESPRDVSADIPGMLSRRIPFSDANWQQIKRQLPVPATVNDLLLAATFVTLCRWNDQFTDTSSRYWIRLAVPMDLGSRGIRDFVAANYSSMVFSDRRADHIRRPADLLADIYRETQWIKRYDIGFVLLDVLRLLDSIPGGMKAGVASKSCASTAVVSNLGRLRSFLPHDDELEVGAASLEEFDFQVPIRMGTAVALGVVSYASQIHLCLQFDRLRLTETAAQSLFDLLCATIDDSFRGRLWTTRSLKDRI
jgi:NRPS condensation-like uncharacterized protein